MEIPFHFLPYLLIFISFLFILILINLYKTSGNRRRLPPGHWKLPILGNLHQIIGSLPHQALRTLSQKYGPLMHMSLGELPVAVVPSPRIAKTNDVAFANRVELMPPKIVLHNSTNIASAPYGDYWRLEFLRHKKVRSFGHSLMEDEVPRLVDAVRVSQAMPVDLRATVGRVCAVQEPLIAVVKEPAAIGAVFNAADLFPSMRFLHLLSAGRLQSMHARADRVLEDIIRQHQEKRLIGNGDSVEEEDIVDVLLRASERDDLLQVAITTDNIKANIFEMFIAGIETSSLVIEWAVSETMKNPRVLHKAQAEVREVLQGKERFPKTEIQKLKYLKMVIKEALRLHPPGPLLCPRRCREETRIHGYDIPVGTVVLINVWAIGRDPEFWLEPFGAGRRICPGIAFGLAGVELSLAHLLYHFDWKIPGGISPEEFDMTENFGASNGRKNNLLLTADFLIS